MDAERVETHAQHRLEIGPVLLAIEHRNAIQEVWPGQQTASVKPRSSAPGLIQGRKVQSAGRLERVDLSFQPEERSLALEQIEHRIKNGLRSSSRRPFLEREMAYDRALLMRFAMQLEQASQADTRFGASLNIDDIGVALCLKSGRWPALPTTTSRRGEEETRGVSPERE